MGLFAIILETPIKTKHHKDCETNCRGESKLNNVTIYTTTYCPYCRAAKTLLDRKGVKYEEIDITKDKEIKRKVMEELGWKTVPIIVINKKLIGGYDELGELEREGKLDEMLK